MSKDTLRKLCEPGKHNFPHHSVKGERRCYNCGLKHSPGHVFEEGLCIICGFTAPQGADDNG